MTNLIQNKPKQVNPNNLKIICYKKSFQLEVEPKFVHFGSETNLTVIKLDDSVENAHGLIMTAFDPFGKIVGQFIEDDRYLYALTS